MSHDFKIGQKLELTHSDNSVTSYTVVEVVHGSEVKAVTAGGFKHYLDTRSSSLKAA